MLIIAELKNDTGQSLGTIALPPKQFKTGSRGFYNNTKLEIDGKRYLVQFELVEIGSKPQASFEE